jgi:hypothetical protein
MGTMFEFTDSEAAQGTIVPRGYHGFYGGSDHDTGVGDMMLGSTYPDSRDMPPRDGAGLLADVTPLLRASDITFGNLEGPLTDGG